LKPKNPKFRRPVKVSFSPEAKDRLFPTCDSPARHCDDRSLRHRPLPWGTADDRTYKQKKLRGKDAKEFESRNAFTLPDEKIARLFEKEFESMNSLLLSPGPTFKEVIDRIREHSATF